MCAFAICILMLVCDTHYLSKISKIKILFYVSMFHVLIYVLEELFRFTYISNAFLLARNTTIYRTKLEVLT